MRHILASLSCDRKRNLLSVPETGESCRFRDMENDEKIGDRIEAQRLLKGWSRPEAGRQLARVMGRDDAYSGEAWRQWEVGVSSPKADAIKGLSRLFGKSEVYFLFGDEWRPTDKLLAQLIELYEQLSEDGRDRLLGAANRMFVDENPGKSVANPFPVVTTPAPKKRPSQRKNK